MNWREHAERRKQMAFKGSQRCRIAQLLDHLLEHLCCQLVRSASTSPSPLLFRKTTDKSPLLLAARQPGAQRRREQAFHQIIISPLSIGAGHRASPRGGRLGPRSHPGPPDLAAATPTPVPAAATSICCGSDNGSRGLQLCGDRHRCSCRCCRWCRCRRGHLLRGGGQRNCGGCTVIMSKESNVKQACW